MSFVDNSDDPFSVAAKRIRSSVIRPNSAPQLPIQGRQQPTTYIIEPDLMEIQTGNQHLPNDVAFDDAGFAYNTITGNPVQIVRRPNVLPVAKTPDGLVPVMPKMFDIMGNVMSPLAAGRVPVKAGEVVLGSGAVRTMPEAVKEITPFYSALERTVDNAKISKASPEQWLGYLRNQPGVRQEELEYVLGNLPKGPISKEALAGLIKQNKVKLGEVVKGEKSWDSLTQLEIKEQEKQFKEVFGYKGSLDEIKDFYNGSELSSPTKYHDYQLPGGPLSRDTEILTKQGWKRIDSVSIGEEIITRKDENGELEWQAIQAVPTVYAEKLYHFYNQSIDMQVTANHKMVVRKRRRSSRGIFRITAEQLWKTSECVIPLTGNWTGKGNKILFGYDACDVAEFIGWYLAEGSYKHKNGIKNTIQIAQSRAHNPDNCDRLEALFDRLGVTWKYYGNGYGIGSKSINKSLLDLLHNQPTSEGKFIPPLFFNENKHVVNSLLAGLILGDGHYKEEGYDDYGSLRQARKIFFSKSKSLADGVQILALLSGYRASVRKRPTGIYVVGINSKEWNSVDDAKYAIVDYHDFAFCVTVENHCIYVRRNGVAAFTGNSDYQEMLLTLPAKRPTELKYSVEKDPNIPNKYNVYRTIDGKKELYNTRATQAEAEKDAAFGQSNDKISNRYVEDTYKSSHWDEPNILAHVRYNDRNIPDVGKSLHLEEIQSDWHQAGRKSGYKIDPEEKERLDKVAASVDDALIKADREDIMGNPDLKAGLAQAVKDKLITQSEADDYLKLTQNEHATVPDAPFKKNWDELAFKRMLHKAAAEGYDSVSWTPGEAQAARYDLSKQISKITYNSPGSKAANKYGTVLKAYDHKGQEVINKAAKPEELTDLIGKEAAEKLLKTEAKNDKHELAGLDLKVGGEGMKSFYDKMLVDKVNALAKKYGAKVESKNIETKYGTYKVQGPMQPSGDYIVAKDGTQHRFKTFKEAEAFRNSLNQQPVHVLKLTPELRAKAKEGFPLFSSTPITTPVDYDPFNNNKKYKLTPIEGNPFQ